jgi:hypothetical protein
MRLTELRPEDLKGRRFSISEAAELLPAEHVEIFELPRPGRLYVMGADFAHGREDGDFDAVCILDKTSEREGDGCARQVAQLQGRWGPVGHTVMYAIHRMYNDAFILGEYQGGGSHILRWLWDYYGVRNIYFELDRSKAKPDRPANPRLGWHRGANDAVMAHFRQAVRQKRVALRAESLVEQMTKLIWATKGRANQDGEREPDERHRMKLIGGGSPDLVMAAAYACFALTQVYDFIPEQPALPAGSMGMEARLHEKLPGLFPVGKKAAWVKF